MKLEIDIDKLETCRNELHEELKRMDDLLLLAKQFSKPSEPPIAASSLLLEPLVPVVHPRHPDGESGHTAGLRRQVVLALHTGPAKESELAKALAWNPKRVRRVVSPMLKARICFLNAFGSLELTTEGKDQAKWHLAYPKYLAYLPTLTGREVAG